MAEPARVMFAPAPTSAARPPAAPTRTTRPSARPRPAAARRVGPSLFTRLARLLRLGRTRASDLTGEDLRVIAVLAAAVLIASGAQIDLDAPGPVSTPAVAAPAAGGSQVAATARVLDLARAEIGTVEGRGGATPYHQSYGLPSREPWCAAFVRDVFERAGGADSIGPKTAYTPTMANWFRERGQWTAEPVVGALVFYDFPDRLRRIQHVGIVESFDASTITTIEGNTSAGPGGSQANGDGVWRRVRPRNPSIVGYGLPIYSLAA